MHPTRAKIYLALLETPRSATAIASLLSLPKSTASEELRRLKADGLIEEVAARGRRGALERLFSATQSGRVLGADEWPLLRPAEKRGVILAIIQVLRKWIATAINWNSGDFSSDSHWITNVYTLDYRGWSEFVVLHQRAFEETERIARESAARLEAGSEPERRGCSTFILFEMPNEADDPHAS